MLRLPCTLITHVSFKFLESSLNSDEKSKAIRSIVKSCVESFASGFAARHEGEHENPNGTINMKIHNVFIAALGSEIQYYTALVRSLDSSLGNMLEKMAINIAHLNFTVSQHVEGTLHSAQVNFVADLLDQYKRRTCKPGIADYQALRSIGEATPGMKKRHESDYYLIDDDTDEHFLLELKIGGDLDNKKARSEKEAILEQYAILANSLPTSTPLRVYFATAYNRFGEGKPWNQQRVKQFFADEELLIGEEFWNFVCKDDQGYATVLAAYKESASAIQQALDSIKHLYLPS